MGFRAITNMDYRIEINTSQAPCRVEVRHAFEHYRLLTLHGAQARHFLNCGVLPSRYCKTGLYQCNKTLVWHLLLASAAIKDKKHYLFPSTEGFYLNTSERLSTRLSCGNITTLHRDEMVSDLQKRLRQSVTHLSPEEYTVASTLFEHRETHLSKADIEVLLLLKPLNLNSDTITHALHRLVEAKLIQLIYVTDAIQFYDVNTQPHAHIYCEQTNQLFDAEIEGCVVMKENRGCEKIDLANAVPHSLSVRMPVN